MLESLIVACSYGGPLDMSSITLQNPLDVVIITKQLVQSTYPAMYIFMLIDHQTKIMTILHAFRRRRALTYSL
jgi:hypothetical protein